MKAVDVTIALVTDLQGTPPTLVFGTAGLDGPSRSGRRQCFRGRGVNRRPEGDQAARFTSSVANHDILPAPPVGDGRALRGTQCSRESV
jgi:hypothetical protein